MYSTSWLIWWNEDLSTHDTPTPPGWGIGICTIVIIVVLVVTLLPLCQAGGAVASSAGKATSSTVDKASGNDSFLEFLARNNMAGERQGTWRIEVRGRSAGGLVGV